MRTTVTLADDVYQAARTLADGGNKTLGEVISELARRGLRPEPLPAAKSAADLPVFLVPPGAPIIPGNRAAELLADEGAV